MLKKKQIILVLLTSILFLNFLSSFTILSASSRNDYPYQPDHINIVNALNFLHSKQSDDGNIGGFSISAWAAMAISAADQDPNEWENLVEYLEDKIFLLDSNKATDWQRHTLAIVACNENPRDFGGIDFVEKIKIFYDGTQIGNPSNLYDNIFGILALISAGVNKNQNIIQTTKSYIISKQHSNGGWGDADSTAGAIMALVSAGQSSSSQVITDALSFLKTLQSDDGGFQSWDITNAASTSWAVMAISASGADPTDSFWEKNGNNPIDYLLSLQQNDGSFKYSVEQTMNPEWMTSYVLPALLGKSYPVTIYVLDENSPPNIPTTPTGPTSGIEATVYTYSTSATDPDGDKIQYRFDWGDGTYSDWTQLVNSGQSGSKSHRWSIAGTYFVKTQAQDEYGQRSGWSNSLIVTIDEKESNQINKWSGRIRIEGKQHTLFDGEVTVFDTYFYAKNVETGETKKKYIGFPSVLGALIKASDIAGFSHIIEYLPAEDAFFLKSINNDSDWWHFWIDYKLCFVDISEYELKKDNKLIICSYLETFEPYALQFSIEKTKVNKNELFNIKVFNESNVEVEQAMVSVGEKIHVTNKNGEVNTRLNTTGIFEIYVEKQGYVRSEKKTITVKNNIMITKPVNNTLFFMNVPISDNLRNTWIIGPIDIEVETSDTVDKVEFYFNNKLVYSSNKQPFTYQLNHRCFFKRNEIMVKTYSREIMNCTANYSKIITILQKIANYYNNINFNVLINYFENKSTIVEKTIFVETDSDVKEFFLINLFPRLKI